MGAFSNWETRSAAQGYNLNGGLRYNSKALSLGNDLYIIGGQFSTFQYLDTWKSSDSGVTWTQTSASFPGPYVNFGACVHDNKLWTIGGGGSPANNVSSSSDGITWTVVRANGAANGFVGVTSPGVASYGGKLWLAGGQNNTGTSNNRVYSSTDGVTWTQETAAAGWSIRTDPSLIAHDGKLWLVGGWLSGTGTYYNDVWFTTDGISWTQATASAGFTARQYPLLFSSNGYMYAGFGAGGGTHNTSDLWRSTDGVTWTQIESANTFFTIAPNTLEFGSGVYHSDGRIYVFSAFTNIQPSYAGVWRTFYGEMAVTTANDTLAATGQAINPAGTLAETTANDTLAAAGQTSTSGSLAETNADDTLLGVLYGTLNPPDPPSGDTVMAVGTADFRINTGSKVPYYHIGEDPALNVKYVKPIYRWEALPEDELDELGEDDIDRMKDEEFEAKWNGMTKQEFITWKKKLFGH